MINDTLYKLLLILIYLAEISVFIRSFTIYNYYHEIKNGYCLIYKRNVFDSEAQYSGRGLCLSYFTYLLSHQGGAYRRFQRNLASLQVHLVRTYYLEFHSGICR